MSSDVDLENLVENSDDSNELNNHSDDVGFIDDESKDNISSVSQINDSINLQLVKLDEKIIPSNEMTSIADRSETNQSPIITDRWKLGQRLEACDIQGNWYPAKIVEIDGFKLKIHFQRWKKRYDQWFDMDSNLIRLNDSGQMGQQVLPTFHLSEEVLARWTDSKFYPARIIKIYKDQYCSILFYDGFKKKVKMSSLQKVPENYQGDRLPPVQPPQIFDPLQNYDFTCEICKKGFRKESLLLQHKKHYHNAESQDVPSLVPNELRSTKRSEDLKLLKQISKTELLTEFGDSSTTEKKNGKNNESNTMESSVGRPKSKRRLDSSSLGETIDFNEKKLKVEQDETHSLTEFTNSSVVSSFLDSQHSFLVSPSLGASSKKAPKINYTLPFRDAKAEADKHENDNIEEFVKCVCPLQEESGLMVQCELCLAWQHGACMGFDRADDVPPHGYFCSFCRNPQKAHRSQRNSYQLNYWLKQGQAPQLSNSMFVPIINNVLLEHQPPLLQGVNSGGFLSNSGRFSQSDMHDSAAHVGVGGGYLSSASSNPAPNTSILNDVSDRSRRSFMFHDFSMHSSNNNNSGEIIENETDRLKALVHGFKSIEDDYFGSKMMEDDEEEKEINQIKATNQLSSALYDCLINLHSLNYKIYNHSDIVYPQIVEKHKLLKEQLEYIRSKIEKIEKEIEFKDFIATHTSSASTLTASSPENFGINETSSQPTFSVASTSTTPQKSSTANAFHSSFFSDSANHLADQILSSTTNDHQTLSSLNNESRLDLAAAYQNGNNIQPLARLVLSNLNQTTSTDESETLARSKPSMSHDYLPMNLTDGELKLEIKNHLKDIQIARSLVLTLD